MGDIANGGAVEHIPAPGMCFFEALQAANLDRSALSGFAGSACGRLHLQPKASNISVLRNTRLTPLSGMRDQPFPSPAPTTLIKAFWSTVSPTLIGGTTTSQIRLN